MTEYIEISCVWEAQNARHWQEPEIWYITRAEILSYVSWELKISKQIFKEVVLMQYQ